MKIKGTRVVSKEWEGFIFNDLEITKEEWEEAAEWAKKAVAEWKLKTPKRDKECVAPPKPNSLTVEETFYKMFERYEGALEELSEK